MKTTRSETSAPIGKPSGAFFKDAHVWETGRVRREDRGLVEPAGLAQLRLIAKHSPGGAEQMDRHSAVLLRVLPEVGKHDVAARHGGELVRRACPRSGQEHAYAALSRNSSGVRSVTVSNSML